MLVVDRVELGLVDQVLDVRHLDHGHARLLEHDPQSLDESVEVGHVGQHVVRVDDVGQLAAVGQFERQPLIEESGERRHAVLAPRHFGHVDRRLDPQHRDASLLVILQQVAVIAGDLDHQAG